MIKVMDGGEIRSLAWTGDVVLGDSPAICSGPVSAHPKRSGAAL